MSTLADELLQDFEDSGSEGEEQQNDGLFSDDTETKNGLNGHATSISGAIGNMELDGDEEEVDEDADMAGVNDTAVDVEDEEETKAKVEKMELGGVDDVRSVAKLMKTLEPVLEVSTSLFAYTMSLEDRRFTSITLCNSPDIQAIL
jgi:U4/U6 small nuclear ribonucleoprotein PRP31